MSILTEWKKARKTLADLREQFKKEGRAEFHAAAKSLFDKFPDLQSFSWTQYTPYFNDGDTCYFSRHGVDQINMVNEDDEGFGWDDPRRLAIDKFLDSFDSDDLEILFGDHARVTVTRDGIEEEEYEHE